MPTPRLQSTRTVALAYTSGRIVPGVTLDPASANGLSFADGLTTDRAFTGDMDGYSSVAAGDPATAAYSSDTTLALQLPASSFQTNAIIWSDASQDALGILPTGSGAQIVIPSLGLYLLTLDVACTPSFLNPPYAVGFQCPDASQVIGFHAYNGAAGIPGAGSAQFVDVASPTNGPAMNAGDTVRLELTTLARFQPGAVMYCQAPPSLGIPTAGEYGTARLTVIKIGAG